MDFVFNLRLQQDPVLTHHKRVETDSVCEMKGKRIVGLGDFLFCNKALGQTKLFCAIHSCVSSKCSHSQLTIDVPISLYV